MPRLDSWNHILGGVLLEARPSLPLGLVSVRTVIGVVAVLVAGVAHHVGVGVVDGDVLSIDSFFNTIRRLVTLLSAIVAHHGHVGYRRAFWVVGPRGLHPVLLVRVVGELLETALLLDDNELEVLVMAVVTVGAESSQIIQAYFLIIRLLLDVTLQVFLNKPALVSLVAEPAVEEGARLVRINYVWLIHADVPVGAVVSVRAPALALEVVADRFLLLDVSVEVVALVPQFALAFQPKRAHLLLELRRVLLPVDGVVDFDQVLDSHLVELAVLVGLGVFGFRV
mmetsp:Transcript_25558/g.39334  ORF Transcript_25558/g.39334 Transcript_25558/m.39334 type:complete len:282 (-) Transcript_25558:66-911(-)